MSASRTSALAALALACAACGGPAATGAAPASGPAPAPSLGTPARPAPEVVGALAGVRERTRAVVRSRAAWDALLARLAVAPAAPPPEVDFAQRLLVVVASGEQPTGGYAIRVADARLEAGALHVRVIETAPGPGCLVTQALTYPSQLASLPRFDGPVAFEDERAAANCR